MNYHKLLMSAIGSFLLIQAMASQLAAASGGEPNRTRKHYVFAHYMVCFNAFSTLRLLRLFGCF